MNSLTRLDTGPLSIKKLFQCYRSSMLVTWGLVLLENVLLVLIPLFIGWAIDGLLDGDIKQLLPLAGVMIVLTGIAVGRRIYDTRVYGTIRVTLGTVLNRRHIQKPVSVRNARLELSRELVDFLEERIPEVMTGAIQVLVSLIILSSFNLWLGISAAILIVAMLSLYALFHTSFLRLNQSLNDQIEKQVSVLSMGRHLALLRHLRQLRKWEIKLSDKDAWLFGGIFLLVTAFICMNLWLATSITGVTAGTLFTIISYSWEFVEAALIMPVALQEMTRLGEITDRLNQAS